MAQGSIIPTGGMIKSAFSTGTPMYHTVCMNCGSVVRSYVEKVDIFE